LGELRDIRAFPPLIRSLNDYDKDVRDEAAKALAKIRKDN